MTAPPNANNSVILTQMMAGEIKKSGYVHVICRAGNENCFISMIRITAFRPDCLHVRNE